MTTASARKALGAPEAGTSTQRSIAQHAHDLFREHGYTATSIRDIASAAHVDPSIVMRHFHSKAELFMRALGFDTHFAPEVDGPLGAIGEALIEYLTAPEHADMRRAFVVMVRASDHAEIRDDLTEIMRRLLVQRLTPRLEGPDPEMRAWLVSAQLIGFIQNWDAVAGGVVTEDARRRLIRYYGAAVQQLVTP
jgi:AcrR family transcriptional regulator